MCRKQIHQEELNCLCPCACCGSIRRDEYIEENNKEQQVNNTKVTFKYVQSKFSQHSKYKPGFHKTRIHLTRHFLHVECYYPPIKKIKKKLWGDTTFHCVSVSGLISQN